MTSWLLLQFHAGQTDRGIMSEPPRRQQPHFRAPWYAGGHLAPIWGHPAPGRGPEGAGGGPSKAMARRVLGFRIPGSGTFGTSIEERGRPFALFPGSGRERPPRQRRHNRHSNGGVRSTEGVIMKRIVLFLLGSTMAMVLVGAAITQ